MIANVESEFHHYHFKETIHINFVNTFVDKLQSLYKTDEAKRDWCEEWKNWSEAEFCTHLRLVYPDLSSSADKTFLERIATVKFQFDIYNESVAREFLDSLLRILNHFPNRTPVEEAASVKLLHANFKRAK